MTARLRYFKNVASIKIAASTFQPSYDFEHTRSEIRQAMFTEFLWLFHSFLVQELKCRKI